MSDFKFSSKQDWRYTIGIIETVAWLAGRPDYFDDLWETAADVGLFDGPSRTISAKLFERLATAMSYQGISDEVARSYIAQHGSPKWGQIANGIRTGACPLLTSYWHFHGCGYRKSAQTCANPGLFESCPLPRHQYRNGNLNQLAYSLFLFIRDIADGDIVAWIDQRLEEARYGPRRGRLARMSHALLTPLLGLHGASHKVLSMALADLLMIGRSRNPLWGEVGVSLIAIDRLVHNFLVRTGILKRAQAIHPYGPQCYGQTGCAGILLVLSGGIDARQFDPRFPRNFPRYIQHAIWGYCAGEGLSVCNGNTIDDQDRCRNRECRLYADCDRKRLY